MPATAEALGLVALVLAIADAHALRIGFVPSGDPSGYWTGALAVVAAGGWLFGAGTGIRSTRIAAAGLGQLPLVAALVAVHAFDTDASSMVAGMVLLAQVAVVAVLIWRWPSPLRSARVVAAIVAAGTWATTVAVGVVVAILDTQDWIRSDGNGWIDVALLATGAAVPGLVSWLRADQDGEREVALGLATALALFDVWIVAELVLPTRWTSEVSGLVAVAVVAVGLCVSSLLRATSSRRLRRPQCRRRRRLRWWSAHSAQRCSPGQDWPGPAPPWRRPSPRSERSPGWRWCW